jgi:hypothetical protein
MRFGLLQKLIYSVERLRRATRSYTASDAPAAAWGLFLQEAGEREFRSRMFFLHTGAAPEKLKDSRPRRVRRTPCSYVRSSRGPRCAACDFFKNSQWAGGAQAKNRTASRVFDKAEVC